jgi:hypothetical protein
VPGDERPGAARRGGRLKIFLFVCHLITKYAGPWANPEL